MTESDETSNGIALCVLHHRVFDRNLVTSNGDYQIINEKQGNKGIDLAKQPHRTSKPVIAHRTTPCLCVTSDRLGTVQANGGTIITIIDPWGY